MDIVVEFQGRKCWEWNAVGCNLPMGVVLKGQQECIVRGISLDCNLSVWDPMGKDQSCGESLFKCFKGRWHSLEKCQVIPCV